MVLPVKYLSLENNQLFMSANKPVSIAIIEDLKEVAIELSHVINEDDAFVCNQVYFNAEEAITFLERSPVDIVLIDIGLPGMNGIEAIMHLKKKCPATEFCMFTVFEDDEKIFKSLKAGAKGYVLKNDDPDTIVTSLKDLSRGGSPMNPIIARRVIDSFSRVQEKNTDKNENLPISPREKEILEQLSQGMLYKEISKHLGITVGTVKQHIHKIYHKLQVNNKTEAINLYLNRN